MKKWVPSHLVDGLVPVQGPGERAGPGHRLGDMHLGLAGPPHTNLHLALRGNVLTHVQEALHGVVHGNLDSRLNIFS